MLSVLENIPDACAGVHLSVNCLYEPYVRDANGKKWLAEKEGERWSDCVKRDSVQLKKTWTKDSMTKKILKIKISKETVRKIKTTYL